jgi:hypothetical protein
MADDNLSAPAEPVAAPTTPPTEDELIGDISNLLDDPSPDPIEDEPDEAAADTKPEDEDPLGLDADAEDVEAPTDPDDTEDEDGPDAEIKGGRFAPDNAKLKLDNGETITVRDLKDRVEKRVREFQRGFTEKTQALSAREKEVDQYAQSLDQSREYLAWYAEQHIPKQPEPFKGDARTDPQGFLIWQQEVAQWQDHVQAYQKFEADKKAESERKAGETQQETAARLKREGEALLKAIPVLKDPVKGKQVWSAMVAGAQEHYGISEAELNAITDHRILLGLRDALGYRRIKAAAPKVREEVVKKPAIRDGRRAPSNQAATREKQARSERLRNSGSFDDGVAALSDFDL